MSQTLKPSRSPSPARSPARQQAALSDEDVAAQVAADLLALGELSDSDDAEEIELPDVAPLGTLDDLLARAEQEAEEAQAGTEESLALLRESLEAGETRRQCFMEEVQTLHGLTSAMPEATAERPSAEEDGDGWAGEEPWWVRERREQAESERRRDEEKLRAQEDLEREREEQRVRQEAELQQRQREQEEAFAAQQAALLAAQEQRTREKAEQRLQ